MHIFPLIGGAPLLKHLKTWLQIQLLQLFQSRISFIWTTNNIGWQFDWLIFGNNHLWFAWLHWLIIFDDFWREKRLEMWLAIQLSFMAFVCIEAGMRRWPKIYIWSKNAYRTDLKEQGLTLTVFDIPHTGNNSCARYIAQPSFVPFEIPSFHMPCNYSQLEAVVPIYPGGNKQKILKNLHIGPKYKQVLEESWVSVFFINIVRYVSYNNKSN